MNGARVDIANATRELKRLSAAGLVTMTADPRPRYQLSKDSPYYVGLKSLFDQYHTGQSPEKRLSLLSKKYGLKTLTNPDEWLLGEDIPDIDLFFAQIWLRGFSNEFAHPSGRAYKRVLTVFRDYHLWFYYGTKDSTQEADAIMKKMLRAPSFAKKINTEIIRVADELSGFAKTVPQTGLNALSNAALWRIYKTYNEIHTRYYQWCWLPVAADMFNGTLTDTLKGFLRDYTPSDEQMNEYFMLLTQPTHTSLIQKEQEDFLSLIAVIQKDTYHKKLFSSLYRTFEEQHAAPLGLGTHTPEYERLLDKKIEKMRDSIKPSVMKKIDAHYRAYFFSKHMWIGKDGVYSHDHYLREIVTWVGRGADAAQNLSVMRAELSTIAKKRSALIKKLHLKSSHRILFDAFGDFMVTKIYRRYAQIYAIYRMQPIIAEIAKRFDLSIMQVRFMLKSEMKVLLKDGTVDRDALAARTQSCVYYTEKGKDVIITGPDADFLVTLVAPKKLENITELKGQTGCVGAAEGIVKIIIRPSDMAKMNEGDILVSIATDPDIVPAMKKAAAIVTEQGGVTSHAAIVSREMNIPCVIGTKIATRVLKDGDRVFVDATKGIVKIL